MQKPSDDSPPLESKWLDINDFEYLCFNLAREEMTYSEPIPDYTTRDDALLQSALGSPRQTFDGNLLYPTIIEQAAILFYSLIKNHPFKNGNKRIGVISLLTFLSLNQKWLAISPSELYMLAYSVSLSTTLDKDEIIVDLEKVLRHTIIPFPKE